MNLKDIIKKIETSELKASEAIKEWKNICKKYEYNKDTLVKGIEDIFIALDNVDPLNQKVDNLTYNLLNESFTTKGFTESLRLCYEYGKINTSQVYWLIKAYFGINRPKRFT